MSPARSAGATAAGKVPLSALSYLVAPVVAHAAGVFLFVHDGVLLTRKLSRFKFA